MKRLFDLILVIFTAVLIALPFCLIALLVRLTSMGPIFYWSDRIGQRNRIFRMPKFRSMRIDTPALATHLLADADTYLTPIGSFPVSYTHLDVYKRQCRRWTITPPTIPNA